MENVHFAFLRRPYNPETQCFYCGITMHIRDRKSGGRSTPRERTTDHILAKARGGRDIIENKVYACYTCNHDKAHLLLEEYRILVMGRKKICSCKIRYLFPGELYYRTSFRIMAMENI